MRERGPSTLGGPLSEIPIPRGSTLFRGTPNGLLILIAKRQLFPGIQAILAKSKVIFPLHPSDMSRLRFTHRSSEGEKMRDWEGQGLEGIADLSFLMAGHMTKA